MNKKYIILGVVALVLILGGLAFYQYSISNTKNIQMQQENNTVNNDSTQQNAGQDQNSKPLDNQAQMEGIKTNGSGNSNSSGNTGPQGGLIVCVDKCGDGVCQKDNTSCDSKSLNCTCQESFQECPQDCK